MSTVRGVVLVVGIVIGGWGSVAVGQEVPRYVSPEELVSLSRTIPFDEALVVLNDLSRRFAQKVIVDRERHTDPIGVEILSLPWRRALVQILKAHGLEYEEYADYIDIVVPLEEVEVEPPEFDLDTKEVRIAAIFFEGNRSALNDLGVNWTVFRKTQPRVESQQVMSGGHEGLSVDVARRLSSALDVTAVLQAFESRDIGEVIANPQITVISGQEGRIQVGDDIPFITRDEAGNVFPTFVSTGIILTVKPEIISQEGIEFIYLQINTERSSGAPGALAPTVTRTSTSTTALLRDGERVVMAGLYSNKKDVIRKGVPFLRNLPWWVFGLRYLTGYNSESIVKKELIVLIQANIVPSVRERTAAEQETIQEMFERERRDFRRIQQGVRKAREP